MRKYYRRINIRFQHAFSTFLCGFDTFWLRKSDGEVIRKCLYVFCTEICTKCVREKRISLHLSSISFNREKKRLFEKKRYGAFIFRIWNDSSQVPTKKSQFYIKKHFFTFREKINLSIRYLGKNDHFYRKSNHFDRKRLDFLWKMVVLRVRKQFFSQFNLQKEK